MQMVLSRMQSVNDMLYTYFTADEVHSYGIDDESSDSTLHFMQDIEGFNIVITGKES